jgi:site-specific recombinase XerD
VPLNLYRRHRLDCAAGHPEDSHSGEFEERKKTWKRCGCLIYAAGTLSGKFRRRRTGKSTWEEAKAEASAWEISGRWEGAASLQTVVDSPAQPSGVPIDRAVKAFLAEHVRDSALNTVRKYTLLLEKLKKYSAHKGYVGLRQWTPVDVREFRASWEVAQQTANRDMSVIRSFFEFAVCNEWIDRNPGRLVKNPKGKSAVDGRNEQKLPFTDDELTRMYDVAEKKYGKLEIKWKRSSHGQPAEGIVNSWRYSWTGRDLVDFISVSVYTGLRISDVATFHIDRMNARGEVRIRTTKNGAAVNTWVPVWLQDVIRRRSLEVGPLIFGEHETTEMNVITDVWRRKLKRLWKLCEGTDFTWSSTPTPHRFRHSFARILLERPGVEVRDVAELLGNSEQMVRKHYSAWIPSRQERLTTILQAAFTETPRPGVVIEMPTPGKTGTKQTR